MCMKLPIPSLNPTLVYVFGDAETIASDLPGHNEFNYGVIKLIIGVISITLLWRHNGHDSV